MCCSCIWRACSSPVPTPAMEGCLDDDIGGVVIILLLLLVVFILLYCFMLLLNDLSDSLNDAAAVSMSSDLGEARWVFVVADGRRFVECMLIFMYDFIILLVLFLLILSHKYD